VLQIVQMVQSKRDSRAADGPSTAHRADGTIVPRNKLVGSKRQRQLSHEDLQEALSRQAQTTNSKPIVSKRRASAALRASDCAAVSKQKVIRIRKGTRSQADIST